MAETVKCRLTQRGAVSIRLLVFRGRHGRHHDGLSSEQLSLRGPGKVERRRNRPKTTRTGSNLRISSWSKMSPRA